MFRAVVLCCAALISGTSFGGIINGDFETGDLTGWTYGNSWGPGTGGVESDPGGGYRGFVSYDLQFPSLFAVSLHQDVVVEQPSAISVDYGGELDTNDAKNLLGILLSGPSIVSSPAIEPTIGLDYATTLSGTATWTVNPGTYRIQLIAGSIGSATGTYGRGSMWIDDLNVETIPEPSAILLLVLGALTHWGILRSKCASKQ